MGFEHLTHVHPAWHAERIEHDVDGAAVFEERQVGFWDDGGDDAFVTVASGHFVTYGEFPF